MTQTAIQSKVRFIDHRGTRIVLLDFVDIVDTEVGLAAVAEAGRFIGALPHDGTALTCTDATGTRYDRRIIDALKEMTKANRPIVKAAAIVSTSPIHRAAVSMLGIVSRRKLESFDTREKALEWLVSQK
jgi:hypothetical protein